MSNGILFNRKVGNLLGEIDNLQESRKISRCIGGYDARAPVGRLESGKICWRKHLTEYGRMERQRAGVDAKEGLAAYNFDAPVLEVERIVRRDSLRFKD